MIWVPGRIGSFIDVIPLVDGLLYWQSLLAALSGLPGVVMKTVRANAFTNYLLCLLNMGRPTGAPKF